MNKNRCRHKTRGAWRSLYGSSSILAAAGVGAVSSGLQQMSKNVISGNKLENNVVSQAANGAMFSALTAGKVIKETKLIPNNQGRPIQVNNNRSLSNSVSKNSLNRLTQEIIPNFVNSAANLITSSWNAIFGNTVKVRYK